MPVWPYFSTLPRFAVFVCRDFAEAFAGAFAASKIMMPISHQKPGKPYLSTVFIFAEAFAAGKIAAKVSAKHKSHTPRKPLYINGCSFCWSICRQQNWQKYMILPPAKISRKEVMIDGKAKNGTTG